VLLLLPATPCKPHRISCVKCTSTQTTSNTQRSAAAPPSPICFTAETSASVRLRLRPPRSSFSPHAAQLHRNTVHTPPVLPRPPQARPKPKPGGGGGGGGKQKNTALATASSIQITSDTFSKIAATAPNSIYSLPIPAPAHTMSLPDSPRACGNNPSLDPPMRRLAPIVPASSSSQRMCSAVSSDFMAYKSFTTADAKSHNNKQRLFPSRQNHVT